MQNAHWQCDLTDSTTGAESSEAKLFMLKDGSLRPMLKVDSDGRLFLFAGEWREVAFKEDLPVAPIVAEIP